jgi:hypothetical protein
LTLIVDGIDALAVQAVVPFVSERVAQRQGE